MHRPESEVTALCAEAERRARAGETLGAIARAIDVPPTTLGYWARQGLWRRHEIAHERDQERGKAALAQIAEQVAREQEELLQRTARTRELAAAADAAMKGADPEGAGRPSALTWGTTSKISLAMAHSLLEQGRLEEAERAARFALRFAQADNALEKRQAAEWREDRARILAWWDKHRAGFVALRKQAVENAHELESLERYRQDLIKLNCCPACSRPMDFWPAELLEEIERVSDAFEMMDD